VNFVSLAWLIPLLPALSFVINILFGYRLGNRLAAYSSVAFLLVSTLLATGLFFEVREAAPQWQGEGVFALQELEHEREGLVRRLEASQARGDQPALVAYYELQLSRLEARQEGLIAQAQVRPPAEEFPFVTEIPWISLADQEGIPFGFLFDQLAAVMILMVAFVSLLIHLFSIEYMAGEARYPTFFAYISLFAAAMLAMVMSRNLFHVLLFWELMGIMSYLLIGFFFKKIAAQQAMKKAYLVTKLADLGFLVALFWIYREFGTLDLVRLGELAPMVLAGAAGVATGIGLLLFIAAVGKSAQFPLHVWLLDAMEGPTPVSAMIHAATMVAAGVYLMARAYPILEMGHALPMLAWIGGFTALFAGTLAPAFADVKKILAWSTVSQLGLMFLGLGVFGWAAAIFHLVAHAFFKALLFLGSGSMIHGSGTQDIFEMNRLARYMPITRWTVVIGGLSLAGIFPFAGFWSKDEIFLALKTYGFLAGGFGLLVLMAYASAFLTAFYTARMYFIAFELPSTPSPWKAAPWHRGDFPELNMTAKDVEHDEAMSGQHGHDAHIGEGERERHPHESGPAMLIPLVGLAIAATIFGLLGSPFFGNALQRLVYYGPFPHLEPLGAQLLGFILGTFVAVAGIAVAWLLYMKGSLKQEAPHTLTETLQRRYYLDELYYRLFAGPLTRVGTALPQFDNAVIDGAVDGLGRLSLRIGNVLRRLQTGRVEHYAWTMALGALVLIIIISLGAQR
jgi:NADH-quinone oxidoreductase subunit L